MKKLGSKEVKSTGGEFSYLIHYEPLCIFTIFLPFCFQIDFILNSGIDNLNGKIMNVTLFTEIWPCLGDYAQIMWRTWSGRSKLEAIT